MAPASVILGSFLLVFFLILTCPSTLTQSKRHPGLEVMNEDQVKQLIADDTYVVVLFSSSVMCTGRCKELEDTLAYVREDAVEVLNAWVVRTHAPALAKQYGINSKQMGAAVIFIRNGIPLLYTGPTDDEDEMMLYLVTNTESAVHSLSDVNFEQLTQAATGATTGDWLVMFSRSECDTCLQLRATIEAVAADLKSQKSVAIVDRDNDGGQTTRRFGVKTFPSFILFRHGRMYRYNYPGTDDQNLKLFAIQGFRQARAEDIPHPKTPFDDCTEWIADWLRENPKSIFVVLVLVVVVVVLIIVRSAAASSEKLSKKRK